MRFELLDRHCRKSLVHRRDRKVRVADAHELARERFAGGLVQVRHHDPKAAARIVELSELRELVVARPRPRPARCAGWYKLTTPARNS